jgi:hypothetical protein
MVKKEREQWERWTRRRRDRFEVVSQSEGEYSRINVYNDWPEQSIRVS